MKHVILLLATSVAALSSAHAGGKKYIQVHAGVFQQTEDTVEFASDQFLGQALDVEADAEADLGFAIGGLVGAYVAPFIALEGEITMRTANLDDVSVDGVTSAIDDDLRTIAFMVNGVVRPNTPIPLLPDPYIGVGVGYLTSNLETLNGDDADGQFAWQIKAGLSFDLLPTPGKLGVEVNYLATDDFDLGGEIAADQINANYAYGGVTGLLTYKVGF